MYYNTYPILCQAKKIALGDFKQALILSNEIDKNK